MTEDPLLRFRPEFPILEKTTYLISNSLGAMPRGAEDSWSSRTAADSAPRPPRAAERRGGAVSVDFDQALEVSRELNARDVVVDYRPGAGIRLSPHFYTADEELDRAFDVIDVIRATRAWERWINRPTVVT